MIGGLNSSSFSLAMRTAERANKTMDKMSAQIATGKKVASVKDDGAAYAISNALRSQKTVEEVRSDFTISRYRANFDFTYLAQEQTVEALKQLKSLAVSIGQYAVGSAQRQAIKAEWDAWVKSVEMAAIENPVKADGWTGHTAQGTILAPNDPVTANFYTLAAPSADLNYGWLGASSGGPTIAVLGFDVVNANATQLSQVVQSIDWHADNITGDWTRKMGEQMRATDRLSIYTEANINRIDSAIGTITDADMGKVSRDYEMAQTRQNLAYQTVRNAISQYGNVASNLLNNVMGTQRSVRA